MRGFKINIISVILIFLLITLGSCSKTQKNELVEVNHVSSTDKTVDKKVADGKNVETNEVKNKDEELDGEDNIDEAVDEDKISEEGAKGNNEEINNVSDEDDSNQDDSNTGKENYDDNQTVDGAVNDIYAEKIKEVEDSSSLTVLVNYQYKLYDGYIPPDLVVTDVIHSAYSDVTRQMREEPAAKLKELFDAAVSEEGYYFYAISGYRPYEMQKRIFESEVERSGLKAAKDLIAWPGTSEHQTGLAMDVSIESEGFDLQTTLGDKAEGKWLAENCHRFGFIIRYPADKYEITKISYEPWHIRYVGEEIAKIIYDNGWCLEEYYEMQ